MAPAAQRSKKAPAAKVMKNEEPPVQQEEVVMKDADEQKEEETPQQEAAVQQGDEEEQEVEEVEEVEEEDEEEDDEAGEEEEDEEAGVKIAEEDEAVGEDEEEEEAGDDAAEQVGHDKDVTMRNAVEDDSLAAVPSGGEGEANVGRKGSSADEDDDGAAPAGGKVFIGGLTWDTTTELLTNHFKKYGEITDAVVMRNRNTGQPRGFGFVTFADPSVLDKVLKDNHVLDGRTVEVKVTVPREKMSASSKGPKTKKIFVGGLTTATTDEELKSYFSKFGKVVEHQIMQDHGSGKSRGFGFVTFENEQTVEELLEQGKMHELDGKQVEIKKAEPKRANAGPPAPAGRGPSGSRGSASYGVNPGFYGAYNGEDAFYAGGGGGYYSRGGGRHGGPGGYAFGGNAYGYGGGGGGGGGGGYGASYGYGDFDDGYGGMGYGYGGYGSGSSYGYGYGGNSRSYGSGRYHPYGR